jgi:hypothetical protein
MYTFAKCRNKYFLPKEKLPVKGRMVTGDVRTSCDDKVGAVPLDGSSIFGCNRI